MRRFSFLRLIGVAATLAAAPFLCVGCSGVAVTKQPTKSLEPHYLASQPPPAFDLSHPVQGHAWRNADGSIATVITYRFEKGNGSKSQRAAAIRGIGQWNRLPPPCPDFQLVPDDAPAAAVVVRFVDAGPGQELPPGIQGRASWFPGSAPTTGRIWLNRGILNPSELASDALHEAGHIAFCGADKVDSYDRSHSPEVGDAMYRIIQPYVSTLTTRDANSAERSYGAVPSRLVPSEVPQVWGSVDCRFQEE